MEMIFFFLFVSFFVVLFTFTFSSLHLLLAVCW
jgi:hypothetical protein